MTRSHNIDGCEATDQDRRLIDFCHAHGSIVVFPRRRRSAPVFAFFAGAVLAAAAIAFMLARR